jgi:hypothetical protein
LRRGPAGARRGRRNRLYRRLLRVSGLAAREAQNRARRVHVLGLARVLHVRGLLWRTIGTGIHGQTGRRLLHLRDVLRLELVGQDEDAVLQLIDFALQVGLAPLRFGQAARNLLYLSRGRPRRRRMGAAGTQGRADRGRKAGYPIAGRQISSAVSYQLPPKPVNLRSCALDAA